LTGCPKYSEFAGEVLTINDDSETITVSCLKRSKQEIILYKVEEKGYGRQESADEYARGKRMGGGNTRELVHYQEFQRVYKLLRQEMLDKWKRCVPLNDLLTDRWEKAQFLGFGKKTSVYDSCLILGDVQVGENTWIGPFTVLDGSGSLTIGSYCSISAGVQIYTHDSIQWALSGGKEEIIKSLTKIGSRCYIGPNTIIGKGVTIGDACIIGANSLVLQNIPSGMKAFGNPAQLISPTEQDSL
jgi:acetyltransferase-like isoleucine patch superfamily enzyme